MMYRYDRNYYTFWIAARQSCSGSFPALFALLTDSPKNKNPVRLNRTGSYDNIFESKSQHYIAAN